MLSVRNNMPAWNAERQFGFNNRNNVKTMEKLSSGYRINRGAEDAQADQRTDASDGECTGWYLFGAVGRGRFA